MNPRRPLRDTHPFQREEADAIVSQLTALGYQARTDVDGTCNIDLDTSEHFHAHGVIVFATPKALRKLGVNRSTS